MNRYLLSIVFLTFIFVDTSAKIKSFEGLSVDFSKGNLTVSSDGHFLEHADGTPFFYLADTGWEMFRKLTLEEAEFYLENRRSKGFTVIQVRLLSGRNCNVYGDSVFINCNPQTPNPNFFMVVDSMIRIAESKGIYIAFVPLWSNYVEKLPWSNTLEPSFNPELVYDFGKFLGNRYKNFPNIIWLNGGDHFGGDEGYLFTGVKFDARPIWEALARGINETDPNHLISFHPIGWNSSSKWFHNSDWLDFNMIQTGHHDWGHKLYHLVTDDYNLLNPKPTLDGEPPYDMHPIRWNADSLGRFNQMHIRQCAYWSLFAGAFGHTYGCHPVWMFARDSSTYVNGNPWVWTRFLDNQGAKQMGYLRQLMESRPVQGRKPYPEIILNPRDEFQRIVALHGDGFIMVYSPQGYEIELFSSKLNVGGYNVWWFDPRTGKTIRSGLLTVESDTRVSVKLVPPSRGPGFDWVLVMDEADKVFDIPRNL
jgi:hypothetical protein